MHWFWSPCRFEEETIESLGSVVPQPRGAEVATAFLGARLTPEKSRGREAKDLPALLLWSYLLWYDLLWSARSFIIVEGSSGYDSVYSMCLIRHDRYDQSIEAARGSFKGTILATAALSLELRVPQPYTLTGMGRNFIRPNKW